jgi:hypothetical protein
LRSGGTPLDPELSIAATKPTGAMCSNWPPPLDLTFSV